MPDTTSVSVGNETGVVAVAEMESTAAGVFCFACSHPGSVASPPRDKASVYAKRVGIISYLVKKPRDSYDVIVKLPRGCQDNSNYFFRPIKTGGKAPKPPQAKMKAVQSLS